MLIARLLTALMLVFCLVPQARADWKDDIGYTRLLGEKGGSLENGTGINLSQVEANLSKASMGLYSYMPDTMHPQFTNKMFIDASGLSTGISPHATSVGQYMFGNSFSIAGGTQTITSYDADDFLDNKLGFTSGTDPVSFGFRVQNHSYIGFDTQANAIDYLQRFDYAMDRDNIISVVALGNNENAPLPQLLSHSFNSIAVGQTNGLHASGDTTFYVNAGRIKPDIVAPQNFTSFTTPMVGGAAAVLSQKAINMGNTDAELPESIKAVLLAGATKTEFSDWTNSSMQPLDDRYGAGELNVYNSYHIMEGGEFDGTVGTPSEVASDFGWDYEATIDPANPFRYSIEVTDTAFPQELSIALTWNLEVTDLDADVDNFDAMTDLANLDLRLFDSGNNLVASSLSTIDNVEHIYLNDIAGGIYTFEVSSDSAIDFAIAWRTNAVPEPGQFVILLLGVVGFVCAVRRRKRIVV